MLRWLGGRLALWACRALQGPRVLFYRALSSNKVCGAPRRFQPIHCVGSGTVIIEKSVTVGYFPSPYFFTSIAYIEARHRGATIRIGPGTRINNGFTAIANGTSIAIGGNCLIGTNVEIIDSDFHRLAVGERGAAGHSPQELSRAVVIGDGVFIGSNVKIMKGVAVGTSSVIANGSVVSGKFPSGVVIGGNPARVIRTLG